MLLFCVKASLIGFTLLTCLPWAGFLLWYKASAFAKAP